MKNEMKTMKEMEGKIEGEKNENVDSKKYPSSVLLINEESENDYKNSSTSPYLQSFWRVFLKISNSS